MSKNPAASGKPTAILQKLHCGATFVTTVVQIKLFNVIVIKYNNESYMTNKIKAMHRWKKDLVIVQIFRDKIKVYKLINWCL